MVDAVSLPVPKQLSHRRRYAGVLRFARAQAHYESVSVIKVKSHQKYHGLEGVARRMAVGNDLADRAAKEAVARHPQPSKEIVEAAKDQYDTAFATLRVAAAVLKLWPPPAQRPAKLPVNGGRPRASPATSGVRANPHKWSSLSGLWRCGRCLASSRLKVPPVNGCTVVPRFVARHLRNPAGHWRCYHARPSGDTILCHRCGDW